MERLQGYEVVVASNETGPWIKAEAVNPAVENCTAEIVVVHDADVWSPHLSEAIEAVEQGAPWAIPHGLVHRLTPESTERYMAGAELEGLETTERPHRGMEGGGIVVAPRKTLVDVPLDSRFIGWGQEDHAWGLALSKLAGHRWRHDAPLAHLWHPPEERLTRRYGSLAGRALKERYAAAAQRGPEAMEQLIEEAKRANAADKPHSYRHPTLVVE